MQDCVYKTKGPTISKNNKQGVRSYGWDFWDISYYTYM